MTDDQTIKNVSPKKFPTKGFVIFIVVGLVIAMAIGNIQKDALESAKTPAQKEAEAKSKIAEDADLFRAQSLIVLLRKQVNDPDSLMIEQAYTKSSPAVACISYRARNGFGGMVKSQIMTIKGRVYSDAGQWNKYCVGDGFHDVSTWNFPPTSIK
jgi:hypothetical protein